MRKKILCLILAVLLVAAMVACGSKSSSSSGTSGNTKPSTPASSNLSESNAQNGYYVFGDDYENNPIELGTPEAPLNPKTVYENLTYTPQMFYGNYVLPGGEADEKAFEAETAYVPFVDADGRDCEISAVPCKLQAGPENLAHYVTRIEEYNWTRLYFSKKSQQGSVSLYPLMGAYTIEGNTFVFKPLKNFHVDEENNQITYSFMETGFRYTFEFSGRALTFRNDSQSVTMYSGIYPYDYVHFNGDNYLTPDCKTIDGIDYLSIYFEMEYDTEFYDEPKCSIFYGSDDWENEPAGIRRTIGRFEENGLFTFTIPWETGTKTYQFIYFLCDNDGIVLTDGVNNYYYILDSFAKNKNNMSIFITEDQTGMLDELSESELEAIVEKKDNLMEDLVQAFTDAGIQVSVDAQSGELRMDASILFGGDSAVLTDEGKGFLNQFVDVYTSIIFSEKYDGFVEKTIVEGHAAPIPGATYEYGLPLSQERAKNVKDYCLSAETGVNTEKLSASLEAIGYSNTRPILDEKGNVDQEASRRVSFRITINLGN